MKQAQLIYIIGDTHMDWGPLNRFIEQEIRNAVILPKLLAKYDELEVLLFVCGDFGYFPQLHGVSYEVKERMIPQASFSGDVSGKPQIRFITYDQYCILTQVDGIKDGYIKIFWCPGNHENHDALDRLDVKYPNADFIPITPQDSAGFKNMPYVFYARFGSILTLLDGTKVMFCGGARSQDKHHREEGLDWWPGEEITEADMARLSDPQKDDVNWIISHTSPQAFKVRASSLWNNFLSKDQDPSRRFLELVRRMYAPERWWFGHYHWNQSGTFDGCRWRALDCMDEYDRHLYSGKEFSFEKRLIRQAKRPGRNPRKRIDMNSPLYTIVDYIWDKYRLFVDLHLAEWLLQMVKSASSQKSLKVEGVYGCRNVSLRDLRVFLKKSAKYMWETGVRAQS